MVVSEFKMLKTVKTHINKWLNPNNMVDALSPLRTISFLFGLLPYKLKDLQNLSNSEICNAIDYIKRNSGQFAFKLWWKKLSISDFALTLTHLTVFLYSVYYQVMLLLQSNKYYENPTIFTLLFILFLIFVYFTTVVSMFLTKIFLNRHVDNMRIICNEIDELLLANNIDMTQIYRKTKIISMIYFTISVTVALLHSYILINFLSSAMVEPLTFIEIFFFISPFIYFTLTITEYLITLSQIRYRYDKLHEILKDLNEYIKDNYHTNPITFIRC